MEGGGLAGDESKGHDVVRVDTQKTYNSMLERKQAQVARNAKFERRAMVLTKRFLKNSEDAVKEKQARAAEASQRSYERNMQKVEDSLQAESLLRQMVKEERNQISQLMHEKAKQRQAEEDKRVEKEATRRYYIQARNFFDQQQAEKRHKKVEEEAKAKQEATQARMDKHDETSKEVLNQQTEERKLLEDKFNTSLAKVEERRAKKELQYRQDRRECLKTRAQKLKDAEEVRQKRNDQVQQAARESTERQKQKIELIRKEEEDRIQEKRQMLIDKMSAAERRLQENSRQDSLTAREQQSQKPSVAEKKRQQEAAPAKIEERGRGTQMTSTWSKELIEANTQAHKDYYQRDHALREAEHGMLMKKRYKKLEEGAKEDEQDIATSRLRSVHNMYIAQKPREPQNKDAPISSRSSVRPSPRPPRHGRCGLCEREYPIENLVGSALRRTVERLRHQSPNLPKTGRGVKERQAFCQNPENAEGAAHTAQGSVITDEIVETAKSSLERGGLYDYEVRLCINCDIFVRIAST